MSTKRAADNCESPRENKVQKVADISMKAVNTIRLLAADTVQKAKSGHPGAPMGCAPMAHILFNNAMTFAPSAAKWWNRDRFVLSNGHACALQYTMLHLCGYKVTMDDLKSFRQMGAITPGHPENFVTEGVEVSTGPLGQGISNAVGMAIAQTHLAGKYNKPGFELFNNFTYVITGDGCLQEGVSSEACSLAGHLKLGKLIVLYDDNKITIDGSTDLSFTEDVRKRYEAYGWQVLEVANGDEDLEAIQAAVDLAKSTTDKPTLIKVTTTIGFGSMKQGSHSTHGAPLGDADIAQAKEKFGLPAEPFTVDEDVYELYRTKVAAGEAAYTQWTELYAKYAAEFPAEAACLERRFAGKLPEDFLANLPKYTPEDKPKSTRALSAEVLGHFVKNLEEMIGGSADLTPSNLTKNGGIEDYTPETPENRYIRFGVREHGMAAIANGMFAFGGFAPFVATFLNFITYAWGSVRLSALSQFGITYVMTHDSIELGEDGPTHQPIEVSTLCRSTPNMRYIRPADGNETVAAYTVAMQSRKTPTVIALSRGNVSHHKGSCAEKAAKGAYVLQDFSGCGKKVILAGSGVEVGLLVQAKEELAKMSIDARVVSMPCWELFEEQSEEYRKSVFSLPKEQIVYVEAASTFGWDKYAAVHIGMTTFGKSAPAKHLMTYFGFTVENVVSKAAAAAM